MLKWKVNGTVSSLNGTRGGKQPLSDHPVLHDVSGVGCYGYYNRSQLIDHFCDDVSLNSSVDDEVFDDVDHLATKNRFQKGSDPLVQTARGRLQSQRAKLNNQIYKELKLRTGAENLYHATTNKKLRETVAQELSFVNSNLQLLKEELSDLNSAVDIYQHDSITKCVPMLPFGLKETNEVNFKEYFKEYLSEHYHEDSRYYDKQIQMLNDLRQSCRTPVRNTDGIQLLYEYYNQLHFVESRFFPRNKQTGIVFDWYDSLTGVPTSQSTVVFERGSVLFNIASLYTQVGAKQDRKRSEGISHAINYFRCAAGAFFYLHENFNFAPSMDMFPATLTMLAKLMIAQAHECGMEKAMLEGIPSGAEAHIHFAQEAAFLSQLYEDVRGLMSVDLVCDYVPPSWASISLVKLHYFNALAYHHIALALLDQPDSSDLELLGRLLADVYREADEDSTASDYFFCRPPQDDNEKLCQARAHLRQSILESEEALTVHNQNRQLRKIDTFLQILTDQHERSLIKFASLEEEDDFAELMTAPKINVSDVDQLTGIVPAFSSHKVKDIFEKLGPLSVFSANHEWSAPRPIDMYRVDPIVTYGFSLRGDAPVIVAFVEHKSIAQRAGLRAGDFLVSVSDVDVRWSKHDEVVQMIKDSGAEELHVNVITPQDKNYLQTLPSVSENEPFISNGDGGLNKKIEKKNSIWTLRKKLSPAKEKPGKQNPPFLY